jgi:hypothetical protein
LSGDDQLYGVSTICTFISMDRSAHPFRCPLGVFRLRDADSLAEFACPESPQFFSNGLNS